MLFFYLTTYIIVKATKFKYLPIVLAKIQEWPDCKWISILISRIKIAFVGCGVVVICALFGQGNGIPLTMDNYSITVWIIFFHCASILGALATPESITRFELFDVGIIHTTSAGTFIFTERRISGKSFSVQINNQLSIAIYL